MAVRAAVTGSPPVGAPLYHIGTVVSTPAPGVGLKPIPRRCQHGVPLVLAGTAVRYSAARYLPRGNTGGVQHVCGAYVGCEPVA